MKITESNPQKVILSVIEKGETYLKPTYGPAGKKTLIQKGEFEHEAVDDGKRSFEAFELENEFENAVVEHIKEVVRKGKDGTTTAFLINSGIIKEAFKNIDDEMANHDYHGMALELEKGLNEAIKQLKSKPVKTKDELYAVAYNSYKNEEVAELIADTVFKIGKDGVVAIEDSQTTTTTVEVVNGLELNKGYVSPYFINSEDKERVILKDAQVILINKKVNTLNEILPLISKTNPQNPSQRVFDVPNPVIIAEGFGEDLINRLVFHKLTGAINPLLVETPHSANKLEKLKDIAVITGAKVIDTNLGLSLDKATKDCIGYADSVITTKDRTKIINGKGKKTEIKEYVEGLKALEPQNAYEKDNKSKRIAELLGGIAVIKVGAYTDNELKGMKTKVENAINSTQMAFKSGVVSGAGKALLDLKTSSSLLNEALKNPRTILEENGVQYLDENTIDPTEVVITALTTGVSIAKGLITLGGISTNKRKRDDYGNPI